jgi:hypothetical protein
MDKGDQWTLFARKENLNRYRPTFAPQKASAATFIPSGVLWLINALILPPLAKMPAAKTLKRIRGAP